MTNSDDFSIRQQVFRLLEKNHELRAKDICKLMDINYKKYGKYVRNLRSQWKHNYKNRHVLKCLSFHNVCGWVYVLRSVDRGLAVGRGWLVTRARNRMLVWRDVLGRLEWFETGRVKVWVKRPVTWGRVKQLLANAFFKTGLIGDVEVFDLWAGSVRFKGAHLVYDTGERLPYARIDYLKEALGVVVKTGDVTHPTAIELEFTYPDWAERNERLIEQNTKMLQQFSDFLKELTQPKPPERQDRNMIV